MAAVSPSKKTAKLAAPDKKSVAVKQRLLPVKPRAAAKSVLKTPRKSSSANNGPLIKASALSDSLPIEPKIKAKSAAEQKNKIKKSKLIRDSFTMPEAEYQVLGEVKKACIKAGFEVKKSELLRVGVALIQKIELVQLKNMLAALTPLKVGRPKKNK